MSQEVTYDINGKISYKSYYNVAKHISDGKNDRYFIKYFDFGPQRTTPVNPWGIDFSIKQLAPDGPMGISFASYKEVSEECFKIYLKFLETKNELLHRQIIHLKGAF